MPVQPIELLKFARTVDGSSEAARRAAISRAYYCAYHCAKPLADQLPATPGYAASGPIRHAEVADRLLAGRVPLAWRNAARQAGDLRAVGKKYRAVLRERKTADYGLQAVVTQDDVALQVKLVADINAFFVRLQTALSASPLPAFPRAAPPPRPAPSSDARS